MTDDGAAAPGPDALVGLLARWLPQQRWFAAKGGGSLDLQRVGGWRLAGPDGGPGPGGAPAFEIRLVAVSTDDAPGGRTVYQVPLSHRSRPVPGLERALVGTLDEPAEPGAADPGPGGRRWVYDGVHDPEFVREWLRLLVDGGPARAIEGTGAGRARGVRQPGGRELDPDAPSKVLSGEQSNTSVIVGGPAPSIVKLFRVLAAGDNPDVVVQSALAAAGCERVPEPVGWIEGTWPGPDGTLVRGDLAFATEFLDGSEDAWRVACRAVDAGESFADAARALGAATAQVHTTLATAMPTRRATPDELAAIADGLRDRVGWAVGQAPQLADRADAARRVVDAVRRADAEDLVLQQVHGDYHLGQVLHAPGRGWILLDFEGEPLRPLAERLAPDLALRDVAGMLRSFDYAARHATAELSDGDPRVTAAEAWALDCREAFLDGYRDAGGRDPRADGELLRALELDKALYEVVYETRNRPAWVPVPLHAVKRLLPLDATAVRAADAP